MPLRVTVPTYSFRRANWSILLETATAQKTIKKIVHILFLDLKLPIAQIFSSAFGKISSMFDGLVSCSFLIQQCMSKDFFSS